MLLQLVGGRVFELCQHKTLAPKEMYDVLQLDCELARHFARVVENVLTQVEGPPHVTRNEALELLKYDGIIEIAVDGSFDLTPFARTASLGLKGRLSCVISIP